MSLYGGMGTWLVYSHKNKKWDKSGRALGPGMVGPDEMYEWIEKCKKKLGKPPKDLTIEFIKD